MWTMICKVNSNFLKFCTYLEFDMNIDVVICKVSSNCTNLLCQYIVSKNA